MSLFSVHHHHSETKTIEELVDIVKELIDELKGERNKKNKPVLALTININNSNYIIMNTTLTLGINAFSNLVLLDAKTLLPHTEAVFTGQSATSDSPQFATFTMDPDVANQVDATPVAVGAGNILLSTTATYTDSNSNLEVTALFTATIPFNVAQGAEGLILSLTDFVNVTTSTTTTSTTTTGA